MKAMTSEKTLHELIAQDENTAVAFKRAEVRPASLARELVAFSNAAGGTVLVGGEDDGTATGISKAGFDTWVANVARHNVTPALTPEVTIVTVADLDVGLIRVPKGPFKPYQTIDGKYWVRVGSTNRLATKEELSRLFQQAGLVHFDTGPQPHPLAKRIAHDS